MAYRDPYAEQPGRLQTPLHRSDSTPEFNPYSTSQPHQTYDQGGIGPSYDNYGSGYRDEPQYDGQYAPPRSQHPDAFTVHNAGIEPSSSKELETGITPREERYVVLILSNMHNSHVALL